MKKLLIIWLCVFLLLSMAACGNTRQETPTTGTTAASAPEEATMDVVFSAKFLNVAELSPEGWIDSLNELGQGQYADLYVNPDGESVTLKLTQEQKKFWMQLVFNGLELLTEEFCDIKDTYQVTYTDDLGCLDFYYDLDLPATSAIHYVIYFEVYCAFGQLLNAPDEEGWFVDFNIYNSDTGKLVTSGDSDMGLSYEPSDWEASK